MSRLKILSFIFSILLCIFIGYRINLYFTHNQPPVFELIGIADGGFYKSDVTCAIKADNPYKISEMELLLDGKPFNIKRNQKIGLSKFDISFVLNSLEIPDGQHNFSIKLVDASYHANAQHKSWNFFIDNKFLKAAFLQPEYKVNQGHTLHIRINTNKPLAKAEVIFLGKKYDFFPDMENSTMYECFIPIDCEQEPLEQTIVAQLQDFVGNEVNLEGKVAIVAYPFKKAIGFAVEKGKLEHEASVSIDNKVLQESLSKFAENSPKKKLWHGIFDIPLSSNRITTVFGEIRTTVEKGKYYHKAVDLVNMPRSVVWAAQSGKVIIKDRYTMSGNTVVIDHGCGVHSLYFHLEEFTPGLEVGEFIKKGNPIGRMGKTGYASGYHLHWEIRVNNMPVDPLQWTERTF